MGPRPAIIVVLSTQRAGSKAARLQRAIAQRFSALVLPPVVYFSAFSMSWREFRFNLRPISIELGGLAFCLFGGNVPEGRMKPLAIVVRRRRKTTTRRKPAADRAGVSQSRTTDPRVEAGRGGT
jgi:hypothetical protein